LSPVAAEIEARLRARFAPSHLEVVDDSARHVGHAGAAAGGGHYSCLVVSDWFRGRSSLERHRAVYAAVGDLMPRAVHALALSTLDPEEWRAAR
jgi:BolA family transcriptional regulator, general stress-responsive regulator